MLAFLLQLLLKTSQFKTVCKDDSGCITQLKQQLETVSIAEPVQNRQHAQNP